MITLADILKAWRVIVLVVVIVVVATLCIMLASSRAELTTVQSENHVLRSDNNLQGKIIATQTFNLNRFNQIAEHTNRLNSLVDVRTEETVIEYREILRREKTCDLPVPADVASGLLGYAHRLRASAMHADTAGTDSADDRATADSTMTYCQAVLWIKPLLAVIEEANNNFASIRQIERERH